MTLLDDIEEHLDAEDAALREGRRERTIFLMRLGSPEDGMMFMNGVNAMQPWLELRTAYIHGCFQASLLIGQAFLENLLGAVAEVPDRGGRTPSLRDLMDVAKDNGWLLQREFDEFDACAKIRNPYAHYRSFGHADTVIGRALAVGEDPDGLRQKDCERFLVTLHAFVHRRFGLGPVEAPSDEDLLPAVHPGQLAIYSSPS